MESLELFSGAGGLAKGLEDSGFSHTAFVEFNKHACASLRANFESERVFCGDVRDFHFDGMDNVDLVAGGPPCQPFSVGGKHGSHEDGRDMFPHAIRAIEKLTPRAFLFENVKGLLRSSFSDYFEYILLRLTYPGFKAEFTHWEDHLAELRQVSFEDYGNIKYRVEHKLLNAADFGVPQRRERVFIVGILANGGHEWAFPDPTHSQDRLLWEQFVSEEYWDRHHVPQSERPKPSERMKKKIDRLRNKYGMFEPDTLPWQTVRDALKGLPHPAEEHGIPDHMFIDGARTYPGHTGSELDVPAKTIKAGGHGVPGGENMVRYENGSVRYLSVFEAKRIQSFPDDFRIEGSWGEAMRQIGNAVPVRLAECLGEALLNTLQRSGSR